jgi:hypothetical protein
LSTSLPLLVIDAANVVGSVPDGWWRDRERATTKLRDHLVGLATNGVAGVDSELGRGPLEVILVVEGRARGVSSVTSVEVVPAAGSGDDAIVDVVAERVGQRICYVATADRELSDRVRRLGARVIGPRSVRHGRGMR